MGLSYVCTLEMFSNEGFFLFTCCMETVRPLSLNEDQPAQVTFTPCPRSHLLPFSGADRSRRRRRRRHAPLYFLSLGVAGGLLACCRGVNMQGGSTATQTLEKECVCVSYDSRVFAVCFLYGYFCKLNLPCRLTALRLCFSQIFDIFCVPDLFSSFFF